jgi:dipeptidyl aminopeptidase/acylaminoacyl peptidase
MKRLFLVIFLATISIQGFCQVKPVFSALDVFELEWASNPQISPDGSQVVYNRNGMDIMKDKRQSRLWIMNIDGSNHRKLTVNDQNEGGASWSADGKRLAFVTSSDQGAEIFVFWLGSGRMARLTSLERSPRGLRWSPDGSSIAFTMLVPETPPYLVKSPKKPKGAKWADAPRVTTRVKHEADGRGYTEPGFAQLFVVPSIGGTARQVTSGNFQHNRAPEWSKDGMSLYFTANRSKDWEYDFRNSEIYTVNISSGKINTLTDRNGPDYGMVVSPNGNKLAYLGYDDKVQTYQINHLYLMNTDGSGKKQISLKLDRSISSIKWDNEGKGLYFMYDDKGNTKIGYVTTAGKFNKVADNIGGTVIGRPYGGGSFSLSKKGSLVFTVTDPYKPADIVVRGKGVSATITNLNADLLAYRELGKTHEIWWKSSVDQRDIQGWYVTPPNYDSTKKYPVIVENHGGPIANYGDRFSPEIQLMAAAGYIVFYPNPRGSTSYGEEFGNLLYHDYPGNDYNDVMDGVDELIAKNLIDKDSLYVTGGSAGGIMTAWIIGKNNRFRAAAVVKPVMSWYSKTLVADNYFYYYDSRFDGRPWENPEHYLKYSPISLVGNITTPTLVMVGMSDLRTPPSEAKQLYHALKVRKIPTAFVEIPGASHNIVNRPSQLITKVDHILAWFEKYRK